MQDRVRSAERPASTLSGWLVLPLYLIWPGGLVLWAWLGQPLSAPAGIALGFAIGISALLLLIGLFGFFIVEPNMARVLVLFGRYKGTERTDGFHWVNPFTSKRKVSLRAHNLASKIIKVNDLLGNPIEIAAVIVWQVRDTAQAAFDVADYMNYVDVQIETAVRHMAKSHPYDDSSDEVDSTAITLRGDSDTVAGELQAELEQRLDRAGIKVIEARITHLAYASEIAAAMLQRQQAAAIIAARRLIVDGAVGMVEHALEDLGRKRIVELDDERRATLVGNLLVVLCSHAATTPVINTGGLYN
jgi:regulator of protease activity HflC (stomatin/prohibitin superfamily)